MPLILYLTEKKGSQHKSTVRVEQIYLALVIQQFHNFCWTFMTFAVNLIEIYEGGVVILVLLRVKKQVIFKQRYVKLAIGTCANSKIKNKKQK